MGKGGGIDIRRVSSILPGLPPAWTRFFEHRLDRLRADLPAHRGRRRCWTTVRPRLHASAGLLGLLPDDPWHDDAQSFEAILPDLPHPSRGGWARRWHYLHPHHCLAQHIFHRVQEACGSNEHRSVRRRHRCAPCPVVLKMLTLTGGIIFPIIFRNLILHVSFGWACRTIGFIVLFLSVVAVSLVSRAPKKTIRPRRLFDFRAMSEPLFLVICLSGFCTFLAYFTPLFFLPTFAYAKLHATPSFAFYLIPILNAGSWLGRLLPLVLVPRFGPSMTWLLGAAATTIIMWTWLLVDTIHAFTVWSFFFGVASGVVIGANPLVVAHPLISSPDVFGTRWGLVSLASSVGALIGTPIFGALAQLDEGRFRNAQLFAGGLMTLALLFALWPTLTCMRYDVALRKIEEEEKRRAGVVTSDEVSRPQT
ncbi:hypothetical protein MRB53_039439 [Persea americana]|nr:hypothetical protein MRB53_039439 [Persea americana]